MALSQASKAQESRGSGEACSSKFCKFRLIPYILVLFYTKSRKLDESLHGETIKT